MDKRRRMGNRWTKLKITDSSSERCIAENIQICRQISGEVFKITSLPPCSPDPIVN
jgi:hypothetical protein